MIPNTPENDGLGGEEFRLSDLPKYYLAFTIIDLWPFTPKRLWRVLRNRSRLIWRILRSVVKAVPDIASGNPTMQEMVNNIVPDGSKEKKYPLAKERISNHNPVIPGVRKLGEWALEMIRRYDRFPLDPMKRMLVDFSYNDATLTTYTDLLFARHSGDTYDRLKKNVGLIIDGERPPLLINLNLTSPTDSDLTNYLRVGDAANAFLLLESSADALPSDSQTAVVHLILRGEGVYAIINGSEEKRDIVFCPIFSRKNVIKLLRGWLWVYFWYGEGAFEKAWRSWYDFRGVALGDPQERDQLDRTLEYIVYQSILQDRRSFEEYYPSEIPEHDRIPYLPLPVWILTDVFLRMIGEGYDWCNPGLWSGIHNRLQSMGIKKLILSVDPALAVLPHHAAVLNIEPNGHKIRLQDFYEISYIPWGAITRALSQNNRCLERLIAFGDLSIDLTDCFLADLSTRAGLPVEIPSSISYTKNLKTALSHAGGLAYYGHTLFNWENPELTVMNLGGRVLSFKNLSTLIPETLDLVVLAGCESGMPIHKEISDAYKNINEMLISLTHCSSIVASSWKANQFSTIMLMRQFHIKLMELLSQGMSVTVSASRALHLAQNWIRSLTTPMVIAEFDGLLKIPNLSKATADLIITEQKVMHHQILVQPYAHPYFWSPFYFIGVPYGN